MTVGLRADLPQLMVKQCTFAGVDKETTYIYLARNRYRLNETWYRLNAKLEHLSAIAQSN